jgi:hypothetical protein
MRVLMTFTQCQAAVVRQFERNHAAHLTCLLLFVNEASRHALTTLNAASLTFRRKEGMNCPEQRWDSRLHLFAAHFGGALRT